MAAKTKTANGIDWRLTRFLRISRRSTRHQGLGGRCGRDCFRARPTCHAFGRGRGRSRHAAGGRSRPRSQSEGGREFREDAEEWAEENAENLRAQVRSQPLASLLIAGGIGAFLGAIFLCR